MTTVKLVNGEFINNEKVIETIRKHLTPKEEEKNLYGEVFTPLELVCEMLSKLPAEVWTNKNLKWLDPANGIGNFPIVVYYKLMQTLKSVPEKERSKHIIENMLYMNELNPVNVALSRKIFKWIDPKASPNIFKGDFLAQKNIGGVEKFDIIIGNPPFQVSVSVGKKRDGAGRTLWDKFIIKSFELLRDEGYLCFIHPQNWRGLGLHHYIWEIMQNKYIIFLHIFGENDGKKYFKCSQSFDMYVLKNISNIEQKTFVIDETNKHINIILKTIPFLPNSNIQNILKLLTTEENGIKVIYGTQYHTSKSYVKKEETKEYKYRVVNNMNNKGIKYLYTNDNSKNFFGMPKVIISVGRYSYPYNDYEGNYGISQGGFALPITSQKQGDDMVKAINSPDFKEIIKATKWGAFQTDYRMFKYFKPDFYKSFLSLNSEN